MDAPLATKPWRRMAGNILMYDAMGAAQFSLLTLYFGLREKHKVVEIGSGPMRAGRFLIMFLDEGNYFGVEPNTKATTQGLQNEVGPDLVSKRKPTVVDRTDYGVHEIGPTFDYAVAYSVLTHCPPGAVTLIFQNLRKCFHEKSIFLGTASFAKGDEIIVDNENWTDFPINQYSFERLEREAAKVGMKAARIGKIFQDWFCLYFEGNEVAENGIAQATRVDWHSILPKWERPPLWRSSQAHKSA